MKAFEFVKTSENRKGIHYALLRFNFLFPHVDTFLSTGRLESGQCPSPAFQKVSVHI
jgi:hypothetical protein